MFPLKSELGKRVGLSPVYHVSILEQQTATMTNQMWQRTKVIRRIILYVLVLGYIAVQVAKRHSDLLDYAIFAATSLLAITQLIEDITSLRRSGQ